eukprot:79783-Amphidinium_carterae.1
MRLDGMNDKKTWQRRKCEQGRTIQMGKLGCEEDAALEGAEDSDAQEATSFKRIMQAVGLRKNIGNKPNT